MRVSFILSSLRLSGGVRVVVEYANRLSHRGYKVALIFPMGTGDVDVEKEIAPTVKLIEAGPKAYSRTTPYSMLKITCELARAVPMSEVVFSTHTPTTPAGWVALRFNRGIKLGWLYQDYREMFTGRPIESWLIAHALNWHDFAFAISEPARQELLSFSVGEVTVVGEGISGMEYFHPLPKESRLQDPQSRKIILFLGDMRPRKGWNDFWKAVTLLHARKPEIILWIVSKEPCQIDTEIPSNYIYRPSRQELGRLYASCDVFVSASWWESFGLPPLEAMACGAPVVITDSRGVREYARHGENCLLPPPRDPLALANAIEDVLTQETLNTKLRERGLATASRFTWEAAVDRFEEQLEKVFNKRKK